MVVYSKLITATDAITHEIFTMLVEAIKPIGGEPFIVIKTIEGDYRSLEAFQDAREYSIQGLEKGYRKGEEMTLYRSITMTFPNGRKLIRSISEVLKSAVEAMKDE